MSAPAAAPLLAARPVRVDAALPRPRRVVPPAPDPDVGLVCDWGAIHFYLGTHHEKWIETAPPGVSLFISHRTLRDRRTLPRPTCFPERRVAIDSGAFSELDNSGEFETPPEEYVRAVARYDDPDTGIGRVDWAAPQDHMCEPHILAKTGRTVYDHLRLTVESFVTLEALWPQYSDADCPFMPVIQGWRLDDYVLCLEMFEDAGVRLSRDYETVGVGSVCRRQRSAEIGQIFKTLAAYDLPLHGFGVKLDGLRQYGRWLTSADSMAWSAAGRRTPTECGSTTHASESNCMTYALKWWERVVAAFEAGNALEEQPTLFDLF